MEEWNSEWVVEDSYEDLDGYDSTIQNEYFNFYEITANSPVQSRDSNESEDEERNDKSDTTLVKPTFKSISQAKKRLQAFSAMKNLKKNNKEDKSDDVDKFDKNTLKKNKKSLYPDDKAKAVIREIEEIKKDELRQQIIKQELLAASMKRIELRRSRSKSISPEREKHFKKREIKSRNYRRTDSGRHKSASPNRKSDRKASSSKPTYPKSWREYEQQHLTVKKDAELKLKLFHAPRLQPFELYCRLYNFRTPSPLIEPFKYSSCTDDLKEIPFGCIKYTKTMPSLQFNINLKIFKESFLTRNQLFSIISKDRRQIIEKLIQSNAKPAYAGKKLKTRLWYSKSWKKPGAAECKVLENSVGLSFLQNYSDQEEEENDAEDIVICSSTKTNKTKKTISVTNVRAGTPDKRPECVIEFYETSPVVASIPMESTEQVTEVEVGNVNKEALDVVVESVGDFTPKKEEVDIQHNDELNETKRAIRELEKELERRQTIILEEERNKNKKRKKKKKKKTEELDLSKDKRKTKKIKRKKEPSTSEDGCPSSEDQKKKKKKGRKNKKEKRSKKKSKSDKGSSKNSKHKKKVETLESSEDITEKAKKKRKCTASSNAVSDGKQSVVSEISPKKSKEKIKDKKSKKIVRDESPENNLEIKKHKEAGIGKNKKSKKPDTLWETIEEEVVICEPEKKRKTDHSGLRKSSTEEKHSTRNKDKDMDFSSKQEHSKKRPHDDSSKNVSKHSEEKKPKMSLEVSVETRDPVETRRRDSELMKPLEIELNIDKKYLERSSNTIKRHQISKLASKPKKSKGEVAEKELSHKVDDTHTSESKKEPHREVPVKKNKPLIIDLFSEEFPLKKDLYKPKKTDNSPKTKVSGTPDTNEYWEKDPSPILKMADYVACKPKLDNSWESDEEIFGKKEPVSEKSQLQSINFDLEKQQLRNASFDLEIPLNIRPFKKRELIEPGTELKLLKIENQNLSEERKKHENDKPLVNQLESKVIQEAEETILQEKVPPKRGLCQDNADKVVVTPKKGRWDKKDPISKISTPKPDVNSTKNKIEPVIEISSSVSSEDILNVLVDEPSKVLENEYEEFLKAVTSNTSDSNNEFNKTMTNSCSFSSFSDISDSSLDCRLPLEKPKVELESRVPKTKMMMISQLPDSSVAPVILPTDIPLIPMPSDNKPIPVPSPRVNIDRVSKPLMNMPFSPKRTFDIAPNVKKQVPKIIDIINLTLDDDQDEKIENEVTSTVSHSFINKIGIENVTVKDISNLTYNNDIVDIDSISLPPPKVVESLHPSTTINQLNIQKQGDDIVVNSPSVGYVEEKGQSAIIERPFTFTTMVLPTKKLLLDKSKLNLDDSDEEDSRNKSLQKLEDLKKEHISAAANMHYQNEKIVEQVTAKKEEIKIAPIPVVTVQKEVVRPKSPNDKSATSRRSHEGSSGNDAIEKKPAQVKHPSSPRSKRNDSPPRRRGYSPKRHGSPRRRSPPRRKLSPVDRKHSTKPNHSPIHKRKRSITPPKRRLSPPRKSPLTKRCNSPRKRVMSPIKRPISPRRRSISPRRRSISPTKINISPRRRSISPRRRFLSPRNRSISPWKRSISPKRKLKSPVRCSISPRIKRSISPRRRSTSPRRRSISPRTKLNNSPGRRAFRTSVSARPKSPDMPKSLQRNLERHVFDSNKRKSPLTITSPLERLKRSVADSTISDDLLPQPNLNYEEYNQSPITRYHDKLKTVESPKRIPLDVRISHVLGIKEEPKVISTTYNTFNYQQDKVSQPAGLQKKKIAAGNQHNHMQNFNMPNAKSNFVQVGNMVQIVPTEIPMKTEVLVPKIHTQTDQELAVRQFDLSHHEKSTILQVGNMLQIVPTQMPPRAPPPIVLPPPHPIVKREIEEVPAEEIPVPPAKVAVPLQNIPVPLQEIPIPEKQSAETTMKLKTAKSREEREQRRQEREKRRTEKEKKRREREKVRQIKMKQKTEDMIKRALQLEVEGLEEEDELGLNETPAQWPPLPVTPTSKDVGKSILIRGGICKSGSKLDKRKIVQFADGVKPGEGTSPSGGEELLSPPPSKTLPKEKRYKKSKLFKKKKVKVKVIKKIPKKEESEDEDDDLPPPSPPPGSPPPHLFPPRVKVHTVNNVRAYMPSVVTVHTTPTQQLFGQAINLLLAPTGALHQPPPPPPPRQTLQHHVSAAGVPPMHQMMTHRQAPPLPGSLGHSHLPPYNY